MNKIKLLVRSIAAGDIIQKGAHQYKVTGVRAENDKIKLIYKTLKTDQFYEGTFKRGAEITVVEKRPKHHSPDAIIEELMKSIAEKAKKKELK
jgi:hypothetical protein